MCKLFLYADDSALLFESRADLTCGAQFTFDTLAQFGLQMHVQGKTEAMYIPHQLAAYEVGPRICQAHNALHACDPRIPLRPNMHGVARAESLRRICK